MWNEKEGVNDDAKDADFRRSWTGRVLASGLTIGLAADDYLKMPWDKVVEAAKAEGELTFYAWWGEELATAAKDFEAKHGIKVTSSRATAPPTWARSLPKPRARPARSMRCWSAAWS